MLVNLFVDSISEHPQLCIAAVHKYREGAGIGVLGQELCMIENEKIGGVSACGP